ncbi:RmlC-like cupin domain-containing protein [Microdochium trichocladiopsis]|uniref:RmlC-like cupin domain-containing protein n=1 Tax=Microdochium trichocladiopsis TaxID=1682393 RepID=A0A9P8XWZ5_9PEZI|nr:RmlC-like cupin domain-containing protein [Microdochium trichocladiopsis]KAH7024347.1 RmlC-like cupin domain-containing protein [Microdochium trichocladiopsis]
MEPMTQGRRPGVIMHKPVVSALQIDSFGDTKFGNVTWQTLLSKPTTSTESMSVGIAVCPSGGSLALHQHMQAEVYYVLDGSGEVEIDGERHRVTEGAMLWIPGDAVHGVFCGPDESLRWLYVFSEDCFSNVVYRFQPMRQEGL